MDINISVQISSEHKYIYTDKWIQNINISVQRYAILYLSVQIVLSSIHNSVRKDGPETKREKHLIMKWLDWGPISRYGL